jgi:hypothetical protein
VAHTHEYDCIVCGAHFDSSDDLAKHNEAQHISRATEWSVRDRTATSTPKRGVTRNRTPNWGQSRVARRAALSSR